MGQIRMSNWRTVYINQNTDDRPLTPEILTVAGWSEQHCESKARQFDKVLDDLNIFSIRFLNESITLDYSDGKHVLRTVIQKQITVGEFNTLLGIVELEKFKIK